VPASSPSLLRAVFTCAHNRDDWSRAGLCAMRVMQFEFRVDVPGNSRLCAVMKHSHTADDTSETNIEEEVQLLRMRLGAKFKTVV
jgi:hypothetical protein